MERKREPHWVDELLEKHECYSFDEPKKIRVDHDGRQIEILVPEWLTGVGARVVAESGELLFVLGMSGRKWNGKETGVIVVAKRRSGDLYEVGVWHELYPWALNHFGLIADTAIRRDGGQ
jgi:hypothetical protein